MDYSCIWRSLIKYSPSKSSKQHRAYCKYQGIPLNRAFISSCVIYVLTRVATSIMKYHSTAYTKMEHKNTIMSMAIQRLSNIQYLIYYVRQNAEMHIDISCRLNNTVRFVHILNIFMLNLRVNEQFQ